MLADAQRFGEDRKSIRLNSSHVEISYAVFCLKKKNVHSHAFHRALRSRTQGRTNAPGSFWTWRERMYELAGWLTPATYQALARAAFAEMALAGVTAVGEFNYLHHAASGRPYPDPNAMGVALLTAAAEAG